MRAISQVLNVKSCTYLTCATFLREKFGVLALMRGDQENSELCQAIAGGEKQLHKIPSSFHLD